MSITDTVIAHPGQDVELPCTVKPNNDREGASWIIADGGPYGVNSLHGGILAGYSADTGNNNLIVKNIMINDSRNGTGYECVITSRGTIVRSGNGIILYVAGKYQ